MKRQVLLILGSFAVLLAVFLMYRSISSQWRVLDTDGYQLAGPTDTEQGQDMGESQVGRFLYVENRNESGMLRQLYRASKSEKQPDGSYLLTDPRIELFQTGRSSVVIQAQRGTIWVAPAAGGFEVNRANMEGNVHITADIAPLISDWPDRPDDTLVHIYVDQIDFDTELLSITSESVVTVESKVVDIKGRGLSLSWDQKPDELRIAQIDEAQYITIYSLPEDLTRSMTSPEAAEDQSPATAAAKPEDHEPVTPVPAKDQPLADFAEPAARNIYQAKFLAGEIPIEIVQGSRRIAGLDELVMTFQWDRGDDRKRFGGQARTTTPDKTAATQPVPTETAPTSPSPPVTQPEPTRIVLSGPITLRPTGYTENPSSKNYSVTGAGEQVVMSETGPDTQNMKVFCGRFSLSRSAGDAQHGYLEGKADQPVLVFLSDGQEISCQSIKLTTQGSERVTELIGPGSMASSAEKPDQADRITWQDRVRVYLATSRRVDKDGVTKDVTTIERALFIGPTEMIVADGQTQISCSDQMDVLLAHSETRKLYPTRVTATGNVKGHQDDAEILAHQVTLEFNPPDDNLTEDDEGYGRPVPRKLEAVGNVLLNQLRGGKQTQVKCDHLRADLLANTAVLVGEPALIGQEFNQLSGQEIHLSRTAVRDGPPNDYVQVKGSGALQFNVDKDAEGGLLDQPRQVFVTWSDGMSYNSAQELARLGGKVRLNSYEESLTCESMWLYLYSETPKPDQFPEATSSVDEESSSEAKSLPPGPIGLEMGKFSKKQIGLIVAETDVVLESRAVDSQDQLLWRVHLEGPKLNYDVPNQRTTVEGAGAFLVEDYRSPKNDSKKKDARAGVSQRPRRALFQWQDSMEFLQLERSVVMTGDVLMRYRAGNKVSADWLKDKPWYASLTQGRKMDLTCQTLMAKFSEPDEEDSAGEVGKIAGEPSMADLEMFSATGDVRLVDGDRQSRELTGQRLLYIRTERVATLWGYLIDQPEISARLVYQDIDKGIVTSVSSPLINIFLNPDDEIARVERIEIPRGLSGWGGN